MSSKFFTIFFTVCLLAISHGANEWKECPFNKEECQCLDQKQPDPFQFSQAKCSSKTGQLPKFEPAEGRKYNITNFMSIEGPEVLTIPAHHFAAFDTIKWLALERHNATPESTPVNWDERAFEGVTIPEMTFLGLNGIIPSPVALKNCPGFKRMRIMSSPTPLNLVEKSFDVPHLEGIIIGGSEVKSVSPGAFAGLESKLFELWLLNTSITELSSVGAALKGFTNLEYLHFPKNQIAGIKRDDLQNKPRLAVMYLQNNPISYIEPGAFAGMTNVRCLDLSQSHLPSIDLGLFADIQRDWIFPGTNNVNILLPSQTIKSLTTTVTDKFPKLGYIYMPSSGVETIDPKIADLLKNVPDLTIDIRTSKHLICENLSWMSKVQCPERMVIDHAICADKNNQTLEAYLESIDPDSKCHSWPTDMGNAKENLVFIC